MNLGLGTGAQVSFSIVGMETLLGDRIGDVHLDSVPLAGFVRFGMVAKNILAADLPTNLHGGLWQFTSVIDRDRSTSAGVGDFFQPFFPEFLFQGTNQKSIEETDRIHLDIRFLYQTLDFAKRISAGVVAAVG